MSAPALDGFSIRRATVQDAAALGDIQSQGWRAAYKGLVPQPFLDELTPPRQAARLASYLQEEDAEFHLATLQDVPIGFVAVEACRDKDLPPTTGEVGALYLLPRLWGKGYGRRLLRFGVARLARIGLSPVVLWVLKDNLATRRFYHACGFAPDGAEKPADYGAELVLVRYIYPAHHAPRPAAKEEPPWDTTY